MGTHYMVSIRNLLDITEWLLHYMVSSWHLLDIIKWPLHCMVNIKIFFCHIFKYGTIGFIFILGSLADQVCAICNNSIRQTKLSTIWKSAITCPNPKVNPPKAIEKDLNPISLICILSNELETHPLNWLWEIVLPHIDWF